MRAAFNEASIILKGSIVFPLFLPKIVILYYFFERQLLQIISDFLLRWRILVVLLRHFCSRPSTVDLDFCSSSETLESMQGDKPPRKFESDGR
mmetsp:Transcript_52870/g.105972  ORF Transcript_52870/g.105972 Transcript_52870/m.105972 type:complete len:93 (-) Transcript_52870:82-360(-)